MAPNKRLYVLDGLRLLAALMVVAWHLVAGSASQAWGQPTQELFSAVWPLARYGWLGVELFFLISGFVICMSSWGRTLGQFATSRFVRLFPAYWAAVLITSAVLTLAPVYLSKPPPTDIVANLTMVQSYFGVQDIDMSYWTLAVELTFYVLFGIVVARGVTYRRVVGFCLAWTVAALVAAGLGNDRIATIAVSKYAPYFIAGIAFYLILRFGPTLLLWAIVGLSWATALVRLKTEVAIFGAAGYRPAAALVTLFFLIMAGVSLGWFDWVRWRWVATAGALTYPLYLLHQVIGLTVITLVHPYAPHWVVLITVVAAMLGAAWLVHRYLELPAARLLKRQLTSSLDRLSERPALRLTVAAPAPVSLKPADAQLAQTVDAGRS